MRILRALLLLLLPLCAFAQELTVTRLAGSDGGGGSADATGNAARLSRPYAVAVDGAGNVYVADRENHTVRKITSAGVVATLAGKANVSGSTNGRGATARLNAPRAVTLDISNNIYVADTSGIRKISPDGVVTDFAVGVTAYGLAVDNDGNVYGTDPFANAIKKVTPGGSVSTLATTPFPATGLTISSTGNLFFTANGDVYKCTLAGAVSLIATVGSAFGITIVPSGDFYVTDDQRVKKVTQAGAVSVFAGSLFQGSDDGVGSAASFLYPAGIGSSADGSLLYVADELNNTVRKITVPGAMVTTFAGKANQWGNTDAIGDAARFSNPSDVVVAPDGNLYVADQFNSRIRKITAAGVVTTFAGGTFGNLDGTGTAAQFAEPVGITYGFDGPNWVLYVADIENDNIRKITEAGVVTTVASGLLGPWGLAVANDGDIYIAEFHGHTIRKIDMPSATLSVFAGATGVSGSTDGTGTSARFQNPSGVSFDASGNFYVSDYSNNTIRKIVLATAEVSTLAGTPLESGTADGVGSAARFFAPKDVQVQGTNVFVVDGHNTIRRIDSGAAVTTVASTPFTSGNRDGTGSFVRFTNVAGLGGDADDLYLCDLYSENIRSMRAPGISDVASASSTTPAVDTVVQLDTTPSAATSWQWSIERRPAGSAAALSSTSIRNPTFTPDVADTYTLLLRAQGAAGVRYSTIDITPTDDCEPLATVLISTASPNVCVSGTGEYVTANVSGGGTVAYQWGVRQTSGGTITPIAGENSAVYTLDGADFGGVGTKYLVVTVTPECGTPLISNQLAINVTTAIAPDITAGSGVFANSTSNFASVTNPGAGATFNWTVTNGAIVSGQGTANIQYSAGASGQVTLDVEVGFQGCAGTDSVNVPIIARAAGATMFYPITPCRVLDTRDSTAFPSFTSRAVQLAGACGIPSTAKAVSLNFTAITPAGPGWFTLYPADESRPLASSVNYRNLRTRANNAIVRLSATGQINVYNSNDVGNAVHGAIDVNGYFE